MVKKTIKFTDYNGEVQTEEYYFNLSKAELIEMSVSEKGGFEAYVNMLVQEKDLKKIYELFKEIVLMSYGRKSPDGKAFIKRKMVDGQMIRLRDEFEQTEAFDELMVELLSGGNDSMAAFINSLVPAELAEAVATELAKREAANK